MIGLRHATNALRVVHPIPSLLNAVLVVALARVAGGQPADAVLLGVGMLAFQVSIGSLNDVVDADRDRLAAPRKPIPAGLVSARLAMAIVILGGIVGLAVSATFGWLVLAVGAAGYACGLAYDLILRRLGWGWLAFSGAFPLLLIWTWLAAAGSLPPAWPVLLPLAALAGPAVHLANSLVDLEADLRAGTVSLATQLGPERSRRALAGLIIVIYLLAGAVLATIPSLQPIAVVAAIAASVGAAAGLLLSWRDGRRSREAGWLAQAGSLGLLAVAWTASIASV